MPHISLHEAKANLSELVQRSEAGEDIVLMRDGTPVVRLIPIPRPNRLAEVYGIHVDNPAVFADDFDRLPDELARAFGDVKP